jgi:hypothetical protein
LETVEGVGRQGAVVADALDRQERAIDVIAERPHGGQLVKAFGEIEIVRIVDREFAAEAAPFIEVLREMRAFVLNVEAGIDAVDNDARVIAIDRRPCWMPSAR